jgi:hypothetical protein
MQLKLDQLFRIKRDWKKKRSKLIISYLMEKANPARVLFAEEESQRISSNQETLSWCLSLLPKKFLRSKLQKKSSLQSSQVRVVIAQ